MIKNLWKDSVWSKVISAIIITIGAFLISLIYSLVTDLSVKESFLYIWNIKTLLGPSILIVILLFLFSSIIRNLGRQQTTKSERNEDIFHKKYNKIIDSENKVTYRFNAYINSYNKFPFISELRVYCNNHQPESLMDKYQGCNRNGCIHYNKGYNESAIVKEIETYLLNEWEKINR